MFWDFLIAVVLASLAAITSGLAGQLTATKPWHKWCFWGAGLVMIALIAIQTTRSEVAQARLQSQLDKIQKNTETPPQVTVNPPQVTLNPNIQVLEPTEQKRARIQFLNPGQFHPTPPTFPLKEGEATAVNIAFANFGNSPARNCQQAGAVYIVHTATEEAEIFQKFIRVSQMSPCSDLLPNSAGNYSTNFRTFHTPILSKSDISGIEQHKADLCAVARASWRDDTGRYQLDFCECISGTPSPTASWSNCPNQLGSETKLK